MQSSTPAKPILFGIAFLCIALLGVALYLQQIEHMLPCPLCVMQRYAFIGIALSCLISAGNSGTTRRISIALGLASALAGIGVASYHLYVLANPAMSCGIDPLETTVNKVFLAQWLPVLLKADGFCDTPYPPILGLSIPAWAMIWFVVIAITLFTLLLQRQRQGIFGKHR
ncbi:disulfide bond formation protein B [Undibacterium sp. SXout7W]|uniref:disulfide bond formation protein B n=1 Tax=Undibacterium sp. SXout7W TaxID=3413049 RepID=UPI003BF1C22B